MSLEGKVVLVTGASRGIGAATARMLADRGARVIAADVDIEGLSLAGLDGNSTLAVKLDVSKEADWDRLADTITSKFGHLDACVNNAGIYRTGPLHQMSVETFRMVFEVNQLGVFLGMRMATRLMMERGGSIVNVSSTSGLKGNQNSIAYGSTKWAVRGMSKIGAVELGQYGIRVNSIHPGLIDTPMNQEQMGNDVLQRYGASTPLARVGTPEEVAELILFLCSNASSYCSGGEYTVDGAVSAGTIRPAFKGSGN